MININKKDIKERKEKLEEAKVALKKHFIGIDNIIDDLLNYIQVWYLMPEVLNRPIIINLWGMTGVGKTDLIRKLVKFLDYQHRFTEIELSNIDSTSWQSSVATVLQNNGFADEKPSIILFDEIQRFNTIDQEGKPLPQTKYMDFWELLSDGRLSKKTKDDLDYYLFSYYSRKKDVENKKKRGEEITEAEKNPVVSIWEARELHKILGLQITIDDLSGITESEMIELILQAKARKKIYEPVSYAKTLIIISGNLDEAFRMSGETSETDVDADIFNAFTQKITIVDVKNSLSRKFRPEQVARFGNIHLIYHSLRKTDFEQLIARDINRIVKETKSNLGIQLKVDKSLNEVIYKNGVFPVQGVRPVFSSIIDILESNLSKFFYEAITKSQKTISVNYNKQSKKIEALVGKQKIEIPFVGRIDKIREGNLADTVANISVHECGHAVAYMGLFGIAPLQLKSKIASSYAGGFTFPHSIHDTTDNLINKIKIYLAGGIAEELLFGKQNASIGRSNDREMATQLIIDFVRRYGFDSEFQATYTLDIFPYVMDKTVTDIDVEKMTARLVGETKELLSKHYDLLLDMSIELNLKGTMTPKEMKTTAAKFGLNVLVKEEGFLIINGYQQQLQKTKVLKP
jgi:hypothetical protein